MLELEFDTYKILKNSLVTMMLLIFRCLKNEKFFNYTCHEKNWKNMHI